MISTIYVHFIRNIIWASTRGKLSLGMANNKDADQPVQLRRLISAFVIRFLEGIISKLATSEIPVFWLVSVAEETGLYLPMSVTLKTGFIGSRPISYVLSTNCLIGFRDFR